MSASPSRPASAGVDILVDGSAQPRYRHDGRVYVEALKGREYAIRLRNPYPVRVAVALSVDGLDTVDARESTAADARKWVLGPYETVTISGWQTSQHEARRFEFTTEARSYGQALGKTANLGMISAVFFKERVAVVRPETTNEYGGRTARPRRRQPRRPRLKTPPRRQHAAKEEYAATGMGRRTGHAVEQVWLDLEDAPAQAVNIRYEFRPQLVRLGILPAAVPADRLQQREPRAGSRRTSARAAAAALTGQGVGRLFGAACRRGGAEAPPYDLALPAWISLAIRSTSAITRSRLPLHSLPICSSA